MKQLLYFSASWCGPCQTFKPIVDQISNEISVTKIDVDSQSDMAQKYRVRSVPTLILVENGVDKGRLGGVKTLNEIRSLIR